MCEQIISKLVTAAHTYGQSLATIVRISIKLQPEMSDLEGLTKWVAVLDMTGYGAITEGTPEVTFKQVWEGSGEGIKDALIEVGKSLRGHINAELFVHKQKCADAEMALQEMDRGAVNIWENAADAEKTLETMLEKR